MLLMLLLCARHSSKGFTYINALNPGGNSMTELFLVEMRKLQT